MKRLVIPLWLLWSMVAVAAPPAPAADKKSKDEARRLFDVASDAYRNGFYSEALEAFEEAFRRSEKPELQFNIGLCLEHMGKEREAAAAYRRYLALGATRDREEVERRASALEALMASREKPAQTAPVAIVAPPPPPVEETARERTLRRGTIGAAAATAVVALAAVGLTIGAAANYHDLAQACPNGSGCTSNARDVQLRLDRASDVMWGIAAAGLITTVTLELVLRHERKRSRAGAALRPAGASRFALNF